MKLLPAQKSGSRVWLTFFGGISPAAAGATSAASNLQAKAQGRMAFHT